METNATYYLTYNSGAGVFAFTGYDNPPFNPCGTPVKFTDRKEARKALAYVRKFFAPNRTHYVAKHFRIIESAQDCSHVRNIK